MGALPVRSGWPADSDPAEAALQLARQVLRQEGAALLELADRIAETEFVKAVELIENAPGRIILTGIGKAGLIARKLAATFSSTGTASQFVHPTDALHGDLGCIAKGDVVLILSASGETEEVLRLVPSLATLQVPVIAMTCKPTSTLARMATVVLPLGQLQEACPLGLAPTTSTAAMLGLGDALAMVVAHRRGFSEGDFARLHPGGSLGRKLTYVQEVMRPLHACRIAHDQLTVRQAIHCQSPPGRRTGAIMLVDAQGRLTGIFTDSDLVRLIAHSRDDALDQPIACVMTRTPKTIAVGKPLDCALRMLEEYKISELPVVDATGRPVGLIDITDVIGWPFRRMAWEEPVTLPIDSLRTKRPRS